MRIPDQLASDTEPLGCLVNRYPRQPPQQPFADRSLVPHGWKRRHDVERRRRAWPVGVLQLGTDMEVKPFVFLGEPEAPAGVVGHLCDGPTESVCIENATLSTDAMRQWWIVRPLGLEPSLFQGKSLVPYQSGVRRISLWGGSRTPKAEATRLQRADLSNGRAHR